MISKEDFIKYYKPISDFITESDSSNEGLKLVFPSSYVTNEQGYKLLDSYIGLLEKICNDDSSFISYYTFDCEQGKYFNRVKIDGEDYILDSIDSLYNLLVLMNTEIDNSKEALCHGSN